MAIGNERSASALTLRRKARQLLSKHDHDPRAATREFARYLMAEDTPGGVAGAFHAATRSYRAMDGDVESDAYEFLCREARRSLSTV